MLYIDNYFFYKTVVFFTKHLHITVVTDTTLIEIIPGIHRLYNIIFAHISFLFSNYFSSTYTSFLLSDQDLRIREVIFFLWSLSIAFLLASALLLAETTISKASRSIVTRYFFISFCLYFFQITACCNSL